MSNDYLNYNESSTWEKLKFSLKSWRYIGVGKSLLIWFLAISFVPLATVSYINYLNAYHGLTVVADKSLNSSSQLRLKYIDTYFTAAIDILEVTAASHARLDVFKSLEKEYDNSGLALRQYVKSNDWNQSTIKLRNEFTRLLNEQNYYNFLFIDKKGDVLFSVKNESILGENLFNGSLRTSLLCKTVRQSIESGKILFSDLEAFEPSYNIISGFFVMPVFDEEENLFGLLALQIDIGSLNNMIQQEAGYGESGQAFIVGEDLLLRSATRFGDDNEILEKKIKNEKTKEWKDYILHRNDSKYLQDKELDVSKVSNYDRDGEGKYVLGIYRDIDLLVPLGVNWALFEEIDHDEAFAYARRLSDIVKISFIVTILLVFFISILVTRWFVNPIKQLSSWGKEVAIGRLTTKSIKAPPNEVGDMSITFNKLVTSLTSYANIARLMSKGNYNEDVEIRSKDDILGISLNEMIASLKSVVDQADKIANGDYTTVIQPRSDHDSLGKSLYTMTSRLRQNAIEIEEQGWLKTGLNQLQNKLKGITETEVLSNTILDFFCTYLNANLGIFYIVDGKDIKLTSSYSIKIEDQKKNEKIEPGEGLVGQVLKTKKSIIIQNNNDDEIPVLNIGPANKELKYFSTVPFVTGEQVAAVIQLGFITPPSKIYERFVEMAANDVALTITTHKSHLRVIELLERTQEQAKELEVQQEELRQTNEELQEQTKALKESEETLQAQKEELKVTNEELEERSKALEIQRDTVRNKNKELEIARQEIEKKAYDLEMASKYKSEFLANMSHELRTPLNSIIVLSQLMAENKKEHLDEKEQKFAKTINSSGIDLLNLINDILDLSKVESGKMDLNIEKLYFDDLEAYVHTSFDEVMKEKGLNLSIEIKKGVPESIVTDIQRVYQVVKNLFSNAIKFTSSGDIKLVVHKPGKNTKFFNTSLLLDQSVGISVIDSGIGIPEDKQQDIFEAFKQADGTTSRKYGGTGLGLSISKNFAQLLGGEMQLKSKEGKGSEFTLYLPLRLEHQESKSNDENDGEDFISDEEEYNQETNGGALTRNRTADKNTINRDIIDDVNSITEDDQTVLIIEDDYNFASVIYNLAHDHNFKALIALDGESGLHLADYHNPHAIILDIGLPGMDGYEVMKRLKENPNTRHIPVHFISAVDPDIKAFKMGAIGYLTKPVEKVQIDQVFDKIEQIISKPIKKLLVVEDEEIMRKSIINLMKGENIQIVDVATGRDAFEMVSTEDFDCMILDLGLEDMTGFDLLDKFEKNKVGEKLPIIIYTGRELTRKENDKLKKYSQSIILKGARSFERLLAETTLFLHQVESKLPAEQKKMLEKVHPAGDVLEGKTILLVDDDMRNVFAISSLLESNKVKVIVGKNGKDGIEKLEQAEKVDLVLMDIMMPEMDGYEAMRRIRKMEKFTKLPIIALTAKAMKEDREKCLKAGANEYLSKPVEKDKLLSLLRVWLY